MNLTSSITSSTATASLSAHRSKTQQTKSRSADPRVAAIVEKMQVGQPLDSESVKTVRELFHEKEKRIAQLRADIIGFETGLRTIHQKTSEKETQFSKLHTDYTKSQEDIISLSQEVQEKEKSAREQLEQLEIDYNQLKELYDKLNEDATHLKEELQIVKKQLKSQIDSSSDLGKALNQAGKDFAQGVSFLAQSLVSIVLTEALQEGDPLFAFHKNLTPVLEGWTDVQIGTLATALLPFCSPVAAGRFVSTRWSWERERDLDKVHKDFSMFIDCLSVESGDRIEGSISESSRLLGKLISHLTGLGELPEKESTTKWKDTAVRWDLKSDPDVDYKAFHKSLTPAIKDLDQKKLPALARAFIHLILEKDWVLFRGMWKANQISQQMEPACTQFFDYIWLELKNPIDIQAKFISLLDEQADYEGVYPQIQRLVDKDKEGEVAKAAIQGYLKSPYFQEIGFEKFLEHFKNLKLQSWTAISKWIAEVADCEQKLQMYENVRPLSNDEIKECAQGLQKQFESSALIAAYFKKKKESQAFEIVNQSLSVESRALCAQIAAANEKKPTLGFEGAIMKDDKKERN